MEDNFVISTTETPVINLPPIPFSVTFSWKEKSISVQLENGEDVLKLAHIFSEFLLNNGIPNKLTNADNK
jgi:hypothetical protein